MIRPEIVTDDHLEYLDILRESGVTNMFGASRFITEEFSIPERNAQKILKYWMKSFSERQSNKCLTTH